MSWPPFVCRRQKSFCTVKASYVLKPVGSVEECSFCTELTGKLALKLFKLFESGAPCLYLDTRVIGPLEKPKTVRLGFRQSGTDTSTGIF